VAEEPVNHPNFYAVDSLPELKKLFMNALDTLL
jgi:hypothetical protein